MEAFWIPDILAAGADPVTAGSVVGWDVSQLNLGGQ